MNVRLTPSRMDNRLWLMPSVVASSCWDARRVLRGPRRISLAWLGVVMSWRMDHLSGECPYGSRARLVQKRQFVGE